MVESTNPKIAKHPYFRYLDFRAKMDLPVLLATIASSGVFGMGIAQGDYISATLRGLGVTAGYIFDIHGKRKLNRLEESLDSKLIQSMA